MEQSSNHENVELSYNLQIQNQTPRANIKAGRKKLPKLKTEQNVEEKPIQGKQSKPLFFQSTTASPTKFKKAKIIPAGYEIASFEKTIEHWNTMSYTNKIEGQDGDIFYETYDLNCETSEIKQYVGIFLYLEFIRRLLWTCFIISIILMLQLYVNYTSDALSTYKPSFALTLAKFSLGNLNLGARKQYIMHSACDVLSMIVLFGFYIHWRSFHNQIVQSQEKDFKVLDPAMYVVSIIGFDPQTKNLQEDLRAYFDTIYKGVYEVQVVYNFKRNFNKFIDLQQKLEQVEKQKQLIKQNDKSDEEYQKHSKELQELEAQISKISNHFDPIYAIIHFRNLKSKYDFINICRKYALIDTWSNSLKRTICCIPGIPERLRFNKKDTLMLKSANLPKPDTINWNNIDISPQSYAGRMVLAVVFIAISIFISSSLIALCTLYVTTSSNCYTYDSATTFLQAQTSNDPLTVYCYCSANYASIYVDDKVSVLCENLQKTILISNIMQIAASLLSTITNIILILVVSVIAQKLLKPDNKPKQFNFVFISVFISNLINSTIIPLVLNSDIFGFRSVTYLRFISFIDITKISIFKDFDRDWFAVISPYYTNFFIIASISPIIQLIVYSLKRKFVLWKVKKACSNMDPNNVTIQKEADAMIVAFPFDLPAEMAVLCLQFFMCFMYSSLIPLSIPIFTAGLLLTYFCKKYIILNYTIRIPADESLNEKIINLIPFILLVHGLMGVWARTADGVFTTQAFFSFFHNDTIDNNLILHRAILDIILLAATALILAWIIFDFTIINFFNLLREACKDKLELPVKFAAIQNQNYASRLRKSNIFGSYKLSNHPLYKHPYKAYKQLMLRVEDERKEQAELRKQQSMKQSLKIQVQHSQLQLQSQSTMPFNPN